MIINKEFVHQTTMQIRKETKILTSDRNNKTSIINIQLGIKAINNDKLNISKIKIHLWLRTNTMKITKHSANLNVVLILTLITLEQAILGAKKQVKYTQAQYCQTCAQISKQNNLERWQKSTGIKKYNQRHIKEALLKNLQSFNIYSPNNINQRVSMIASSPRSRNSPEQIICPSTGQQTKYDYNKINY